MQPCFCLANDRLPPTLYVVFFVTAHPRSSLLKLKKTGGSKDDWVSIFSSKLVEDPINGLPNLVLQRREQR
jgi:hypothetical protein